MENKKFVLWFTGLPASGKSTIADAVFLYLKSRGLQVERLDGDDARKHLSKNLGFSKKDRVENIRRVGNAVLGYMQEGKAVVASFITPYIEQRHELRIKIKDYIEVFVDAPLDICELRDPRGMYEKARAGEITMFTGINDPYELPKNPEIHLKTDKMSVDECVSQVINYLKERKLV